jgi:cell division protein FtsB
MNQRELERLEKESIFTMRVNNDLKDQVINGYLNELNKVIKTKVKRRDLVVLVIENN